MVIFKEGDRIKMLTSCTDCEREEKYILRYNGRLFADADRYTNYEINNGAIPNNGCSCENYWELDTSTMVQRAAEALNTLKLIK